MSQNTGLLSQSYSKRFFKVKSFVEKPKPETISSRWALPGAMFLVLIFSVLESAKIGAGGKFS